MIEIFFPFLEITTLCMTMSYSLQATQMNEELPLESSLELTLTQHPHDENHEPRDVRIHFEVEPP